MEHPKLNETERMIVRRTRGDLFRILEKSDVPRERWAVVLLACTVELADQTLELQGSHAPETLPAPPPEDDDAPPLLCSGRRLTPEVVLHCTLPDQHAGACDYEEASR